MAVRLSLFYAAYFLFGGIQLPYWPLWLQERGLGPAEIGLVLALTNGVKVVAGPTGGWLADRWAQRRTAGAVACRVTRRRPRHCPGLPASGGAGVVERRR